MVDLLRDQKRQYSADLRTSIKLSNQAQGWSDVSKVAGTLSSISSSIERADLARQKQADKQAQSDLSAHEKEAQSIVADLRNKYGENITSEKGQQAVRDALGKHFRNYRPEYDSGRTGASYDTGADTYINKVIDENYLYATKAKIGRQNAERQAAQTAARQAMRNSANNVAQIGDLYIQQAGELGKYGANKDFGAFTKDTITNLDKILEKAPGTPEQKSGMKLSFLSAGVANNIASGLSSEDMQIREKTDLMLHDQEEFNNNMPAEYLDASVEFAKSKQLNQWEQERAVLKNALLTAVPSNKKNIEKQIAELDGKIATLNDKDEIDGENFGDKVKHDLRVGLLEQATPLANKMLEDRSLEMRIAAQQKQKEDAAFAAMQPFNPSFKLEVIRLAKEEENGAQPQMSFVGDEKPKGFWKSFADNVMGYSDNMSHVSQLAYTDVNVQGDANAMVKQLTYKQLESPSGDPTQFEYDCFKTLFDISNLEMAESDRVDKQNQIAKLMVSNDEEVKELRAILESGDVAVFPLATMSLSATTTNRETGEMIPATRILASDKMVLDAFDNHMYHAQQEYQTAALNMWANGATYDQIMNLKNQVFKKHVDNFYREFHMVNLAELDEKKKNHEPAFASYNGITYEYGGRDPNMRPIWIDHAVMNTNRDMSKWLERKPLTSFSQNNGVGVLTRNTPKSLRAVDGIWNKSERADNE